MASQQEFYEETSTSLESVPNPEYPPQGQENQFAEQRVEENTAYTHTEVKAPLYTPDAPSILVVPNLAQDLVGESQTSSSATVTSTSQEAFIPEPGYLTEEARQDEVKRAKELAKIEAKAQKEQEKQAEKYRKEAEAKAEKIRKELEEQQQKDLEFRRTIVEQTIEKQKKAIDVEEKFAKKELDREQKIAENALEQSRLSTVANVSLDTSAGTSNSSGTVVSTSEKTTLSSSESTSEHKSLGGKLVDWLLGPKAEK